MKSLRVWLLLLLAFALPIRGTMAAAMLCAPGAHAHAHGAASGAPAHEHGERAGHAGHGEAATQDHGFAAGHGSADKCSFCASCCSLPLPVAARFTLAQAPPAAGSFPEYLAPAAEFFSGGQDRPPRSI